MTLCVCVAVTIERDDIVCDSVFAVTIEHEDIVCDSLCLCCSDNRA